MLLPGMLHKNKTTHYFLSQMRGIQMCVSVLFCQVEAVAAHCLPARRGCPMLQKHLHGKAMCSSGQAPLGLQQHWAKALCHPRRFMHRGIACQLGSLTHSQA